MELIGQELHESSKDTDHISKSAQIGTIIEESSRENFDEISDEAVENIKQQPTPDDIPHDVYLYNLFGKETAENFFHPQMDTSVMVSGMTVALGPSKFRKKKPNEARLAARPGLVRELQPISIHAEALWKTLRNRSETDLDNIENKIDQGLKDSFNSLSRELIYQENKPISRSFVDDLSLQRLTDLIKKSKLEKSHQQHRCQQLMFQFAKSHCNKQAILVHNNPITNPFNLENEITKTWTDSILPHKMNESKSENSDIVPDVPISKPASPAQSNELQTGSCSLPRLPANANRSLRYFTHNDSIVIGQNNQSFRHRLFGLDNEASSLNATIMASMERQLKHSHPTVQATTVAIEAQPNSTVENLKNLNQKPTHVEKSSELKKFLHNLRKNETEPHWQPLTLGILMDHTKNKKPKVYSSTSVVRHDQKSETASSNTPGTSSTHKLLDPDFRQQIDYRNGAAKIWKPLMSIN